MRLEQLNRILNLIILSKKNQEMASNYLTQEYNSKLIQILKKHILMSQSKSNFYQTLY